MILNRTPDRHSNLLHVPFCARIILPSAFIWSLCMCMCSIWLEAELTPVKSISSNIQYLFRLLVYIIVYIYIIRCDTLYRRTMHNLDWSQRYVRRYTHIFRACHQNKTILYQVTQSISFYWMRRLGRCAACTRLSGSMRNILKALFETGRNVE